MWKFKWWQHTDLMAQLLWWLMTIMALHEERGNNLVMEIFFWRLAQCFQPWRYQLKDTLQSFIHLQNSGKLEMKLEFHCWQKLHFLCNYLNISHKRFKSLFVLIWKLSISLMKYLALFSLLSFLGISTRKIINQQITNFLFVQERIFLASLHNSCCDLLHPLQHSKVLWVYHSEKSSGQSWKFAKNVLN